jgi:mediator of RNA polymerase II transcription subunit 13
MGSSNSNTSILRPEELSKMFPTPPSLEHHPNSSPCGGALSDSGTAADNIMDHVPSRLHQDIYPNLGSPIAEPIDDWSYVYMPPPMCQFVGSSKYAPLTNLPSQSLSPIVLTPNMIYKPSWLNQQQQKKQQQQKQQQKQQQQMNQEKSQKIPQPLTTPNSQMGPVAPISRPGSAMSLTGSTSGMLMNANGNMTMMQSGVGGVPMQQNNMNMMNNNNMYCMQSQQQPHPNAGGNMRVLPPGMSPISPVTPYPSGNIINVQSPIQNPFRRTPIPGMSSGGGAGPPPPPYDQAVASPATSTSSSYMNRQFHSNDPSTPTNGANNNHNNNGSNSQRPPEANALLVNVLLYDTLLNIFRDHNFDACTLCVCSSECSGVKWTGNIRGADSGVYLPLPGSGNGFSGGSSSGGQHLGHYSGGNGAYGMMDSPAGNGNFHQQQQNQNGYLDEDPINCRCGFSAVVNRRLGHRAGLFYEDELEITGMAEDPACHKKGSLLKFLFNGSRGGDRNLRNALEDANSCDSLALSPPPMDIVDLLREQCTIIQSASSSIQRAVKNFKSRVTAHTLANKAMNVLEYTDAHDIINLALEQSRLVFESQQQNQQQQQQQGMSGGNGNNRMELDPYQQHQQQHHQPHQRGGSNYGNNNNSGNHNSLAVSTLKSTSTVSVHKWPYVRAKGPRCNKEIVRIMNSMQPLLQDAFHKKCTTRLWEAPYTVSFVCTIL